MRITAVLALGLSLLLGIGGALVAAVQIYDRMEALRDLGVPNIALAEYKAPENYAAADCPLCAGRVALEDLSSTQDI